MKNVLQKMRFKTDSLIAIIASFIWRYGITKFGALDWALSPRTLWKLFFTFEYCTKNVLLQFS